MIISYTRYLYYKWNLLTDNSIAPNMENALKIKLTENQIKIKKPQNCQESLLTNYFFSSRHSLPLPLGSPCVEQVPSSCWILFCLDAWSWVNRPSLCWFFGQKSLNVMILLLHFLKIQSLQGWEGRKTWLVSLDNMQPREGIMYPSPMGTSRWLGFHLSWDFPKIKRVAKTRKMLKELIKQNLKNACVKKKTEV